MSKKKIDFAVDEFLKNQIHAANETSGNLLQSITSPEVREKIEEIKKRKHVGRPRKDETRIEPDAKYINSTFAVNEKQMQKIRYICRKLGFQQKDLLFALFGEIIRNYEDKNGIIPEGEITDTNNIINSILQK